MPDYADRILAIAECELCDDNGKHLNGLFVCDHVDYAAIAKRGIEKVRAALKESQCSR